MYPVLMREILNQRVAERQEEARKANLVRALRKARRQRGRAEAPDILAQPIPDYVDGTFRGTEDELPAGRAGAARK
jgi:hypothetical protein